MTDGGGYDAGGYGADVPLYGYATTEVDASSGYVHHHSAYADAGGTYSHVTDEWRGPAFDRSYSATTSYGDGVYRSDVLDAATPMDGVYATYGSRYATTYDLASHVATSTSVSFSSGYSYTAFQSIDYDTGASVSSYDTRWFSEGGYYEYTRSSYDGPGGPATTAIGGYHAFD